ncbi:MAG: thioredoxin family protein [bacterium]
MNLSTLRNELNSEGIELCGEFGLGYYVDEFDELLKIRDRTITIFTGDGCPACESFIAGLDDNADKLDDEFAIVNCGGNEEIFRRFDVKTVPTVLIFEGDVEKKRFTPSGNIDDDIEDIKN